MHYDDLSEYSYWQTIAGAEPPSAGCLALNVGWLAAGHQFTKGKASQELVTRLFSLCAKPTRKTRGFHSCDFCRKNPWAHPVATLDGQQIYLGNGEIRVDGEGVCFMAPTLIYHYVVEHDYVPPEIFVRAVLKCEVPNP